MRKTTCLLHVYCSCAGTEMECHVSVCELSFSSALTHTHTHTHTQTEQLPRSVLKGSAAQSCHISELWQRRGAARGLTHTQRERERERERERALAAQCIARGLSLTHTARERLPV